MAFTMRMADMLQCWLLASTINTNEMGMDYFQETNTIKLFDDCSVYNQMIMTPEQAPRILQTAIQHAISKKGVAVVGLPGDVSELKAKENVTSNRFFYPAFNQTQ
jgi:pyruvate dehydrogenase (quinone)